MDQVPLRIRPKLSYTAKDFILHEGVQSISDKFLPCFTKPGFAVGYIYGDQRQGKTHLSVFLAEKIMASGQRVVVWDGEIVAEDLSEQLVVIVDDAQVLFQVGKEGEFVSLFERLKVLQGKLILISNTRREDIKLDDHVMSRLRQCHYEAIGILSPEDSEAMIRYIAFQRGIQLTSRKTATLAKQVGRDIRAIEEFLTPS